MRLFVICNFGYYWALLGQVLFLVLTIIVALLLGTFLLTIGLSFTPINWSHVQMSETSFRKVENALNCGEPRSHSRATEKIARHEHELNFLSKLKTQKLNEQTVIPLKA